MNSQLSNWIVYVLQCKDGSYYTGITNNIIRRLWMHSRGRGSKYTRTRLPVKIVWRKEVADKSSALKEEIRIKSLSRQEKEKLVYADKVTVSDQ
jgi:putative endonuclease